MIKLLAALALVATPAIATAKSAPKPPVGKVKLPPLSYTINASGPAIGETAKRRDLVTVEYRLTLLDGKLIDNSPEGQPATFPLNQLIPAWQVLVQLMRPGDDWTSTSRRNMPMARSPVTNCPPTAS